MSSVTKGETLGGKSVWYCHLILPVPRSIATIVPLRNPKSMVCEAATLCPATPVICEIVYTSICSGNVQSGGIVISIYGMVIKYSIRPY